MQEKLIYEKEYSPANSSNQPEYNNNDASEFSSYDSYFGICANTQYTTIPERDSRSEKFIRGAIRISELYRMNTRIIRHYEKISVHLAFDFSDDLRYINRLFGMADKISFFKDKSKRDLAAKLDFYTHVVLKNGISVAP